MARVLARFLQWKSMEQLTFMHTFFYSMRTQKYRGRGNKKAVYSRNIQKFWGDTGNHTVVELEMKFIITRLE